MVKCFIIYHVFSKTFILTNILLKKWILQKKPIEFCASLDCTRFDLVPGAMSSFRNRKVWFLLCYFLFEQVPGALSSFLKPQGFRSLLRYSLFKLIPGVLSRFLKPQGLVSSQFFSF